MIVENLVTAGTPRLAITCLFPVIYEAETVYPIWATGCYMGCLYKKELCLPQRNDREYTANPLDQDGNPVDISSAVVTWIVADRVDGTILLTKTTADGSMSKVTSTRLQWDVTSSQSGALPAGRLYHEMQITNSAGEKQTAMAGVFKVIDTRIGDA